MNKDEIKEVIDFLKDNFYGPGGYKSLHYTHCDVLVNYITNLQEQLHQASLDIQELTERDIECPSWCDKLTNLQQENERLKEWKEDLLKENIELENIRKEAIEYINTWLFEAGGNGVEMDYDCIVDLLNILQNGSEEK